VLVTPQGSRRREGGDAVAESSTSGRSELCGGGGVDDELERDTATAGRGVVAVRLHHLRRRDDQAEL
jgi:hypothetical protein